jgi:alpha-L-rhamnosidase
VTPTGDLAPSRLRAEHLDDPIGIDVRRPRLSWWLPDGVSGQAAYQLRVDGVDQGQVESDKHVLVPWPADDLVSGQRVIWEVRTWSGGTPTGWSAPAVVEAGLLGPSEWSASWIEPDEGDQTGEPGQRPAPVLRHQFVLDRPVERARLYATAHGVYEAFLTGVRVGDLELTPGTTSYPTRLQVQTHDVTALLHEGGNEIQVVLSDGWWRGQTGNGRDHDCYGPTLAFLGQLHIDHPDGSRTVVVTDGSWTWATGPIRGADLMAGQSVDLRIPLAGWASVTVVDHGFANLCASPAPPMRRIEELRPVAVTEPAPSHQVVDLGQNINGWVRLRGLGPVDTAVTLTHGEALDDRGDVTIEHLLSADHTTGERLGEIQVDRVVAGTTPDGAFEPHHTTHGFRYVRVEGLEHRLEPDDLSGIVVHTDLRRTGWFHCSDDRINRLHEAAVWSFRDNACDLPTDCPQRERSGWTGDWQLFVSTAAYLYDVAGFSLKWLRDLAAEQRADGLVLNVAPEPRGAALWDDPISGFLQGSAGWGDAAVIVPWELHRAYGDLDLVEELWPLMAGWVDFAGGRARDGRRPERVEASPDPADHEAFLWDTGFHWGEWCEPGGNDLVATLANDIGHLATAYLHRSADLLARMAQLLGRDADAERYRRVADGARRAWQLEYLGEDGTVTPGDQATLVRALAFGLVPDEARAAVADQLVAAVRAAGNHLMTGFLATPLLLPTLADAGHLDVAYELLFQDTPPAWLPMIDQGATTVWENWEGFDADGAGSLNHYSKGAVISFLHTHTAGLQPLDPAYRRFRVAPRPGGGFTSAEAALDAPHGRIEVSWHQDDAGGTAIDVLVPPGTDAVVDLPDGQHHTAGPGRWRGHWTRT